MIHEHGLKLSDSELARLQAQAETQEEFILTLLKEYSHHTFAFFEVVALTRISKDSVKRSLSNLSGSDSSREDNWERYPLVKREDIKRKNPKSGIKVCTYQYNVEYGQQPSRERRDPPAEEDGQGMLFKRKYRDGISL